MRSSYFVSRRSECLSIVSYVCYNAQIGCALNCGRACCRSWPWTTSSATGTTSWSSKPENRTRTTVYYIKSPTQINQYITIYCDTHEVNKKFCLPFPLAIFLYICTETMCWLKFDLINLFFWLFLFYFCCGFHFFGLSWWWAPCLHWNSNCVRGCGNMHGHIKSN